MNMKPTPLKHSMLLFTALIPMLLNAQAGAADTSNIKNGIFHSYPKNTSDHFITERNNNIQKETNVSNVWAAGDIVAHSEQVTVAMGEGLQAAIWIHKRLLELHEK